MDIRSASKAHTSKHTLENAVLRTDYWDATSSTPSRSQGNGGGGGNVGGGSSGGGAATPASTTTSNSSSTGFHHGTATASSVNRTASGGTNNAGAFSSSWTATGSGFHRHGSERGNGDVPRTQVETAEKERFDRSRSSPEQSTTSSTRNKKSVSVSRSVSRSRSRSPRSRSGSSSSRTYSSESSKSHSKSQSHESSQGSGRPQSAITLKSTVASEIKDPKADKAKDYDDPHDRRPLGICITGLPARSSDSSLRDGLFHEYKKHGKVTSVQIITENGDRYAVVSFRKPEDAAKALEASQGKFFFGTKIKVSSHEGVKVEDGDIRTNETDMDEYHPKATRTLFVGNLEKDTTVQDLLDKFSVFGEIIDVDIKRQGAASAYAFVQYTDIVSVVRALREMEGEHIGANKIKLGFGKSMPTNCVWIDNVAEILHEKFLFRVFRRYGEITYLFIDRSKWRALVFFTNLDDSQYAVSEMRNRTLGKKKIMIDFASRECQNNFLDKMEKTGQLRSADRPDERGLHKFRQRSFEFQEGFSDENRSRVATSNNQGTTYSRNRSRGRSRNYEDGSFQEDFSPARRSSRQSSDFSQSGAFFKNVDDYEQELREYGHSQRERRERGSSPRRGGDDSHQSFEDRSHRSSREVSLDRYDGKERQVDIYSVTRSSSPGSEHNSYRSERFVTRMVEEKGYRDKYDKDKDDKIVDRLSSTDAGEIRGRRSPVFTDGGHGNIVGFDNDLGSMTPPTPTQEEEPVYRNYYTREKDNDNDYTPTYSVIESKPKLKSVWVNQAATAAASSSSSKVVSEVSLPEKSNVRKRIHEDSATNKRKSDQGLSVGTLTLKLTPAERQRQQKTDRKQHRRLGSSKGLNKPVKSDKLRLKGLEGTLSSPGSSGSHPESENGSVSEADLLNLQRKKQALLDKLEQLEEGVLPSDIGVDDDANIGNFGTSICGTTKSVAVREAIEQGDAASMEELMKTIDSKQSCRKQMEQIARMESRLKEKHREKLNALKASEGRSGGGELDKPNVGGDSVLDTTSNGPSDSKRRKVGLQDVTGDVSSSVHKHPFRKDGSGSVSDLYVDENRTFNKDKDSRNVLLETSSGCGNNLSSRKPSLEAESADSKDFISSAKEVIKPLKNASESTSVSDSFQKRLESTTGYNSRVSTTVSDREKLKKGVKPFLTNSSGVFIAEKRPWSPKFRPSPEAEACFSPAVSEDPPDVESNNSESLTEKSSPKPSSPLNDWQQQAPLSPSSKELSDDESSRLGIKPDEPGLLSLMDVDDSLSDTSEDEMSKSGEPSLEDRIRMVDEIMQLTTMNKASDLSLLPSPTVGGSGLSGSASSLSSSLYSKFRIRKRLDTETSGQGCLVPERKSEPSVIVQQLLSKPSILDQDFQRLGQLNMKEDSPLPQDITGRPMLSMHTKAAVKEMPTFPGISLSGRALSAISDSSIITSSAVFHPPVTTSASMNLPTTTTTTTAGQQMMMVTTSSPHHSHHSPGLGSLGVPGGSPNLGAASPRHPVLTHITYTGVGGMRSPYAAGNGLPDVAAPSSQLHIGEQGTFVATSQDRCFMAPSLMYSSLQDGPKILSFENQNLRTQGQTVSAIPIAFSSNHQASDSQGLPLSLEQTLPSLRPENAWYPNGSRSPRVVEPVSVNTHSPAAAANNPTSGASLLPKKETLVTTHSVVSTVCSRPLASLGKPGDHLHAAEPSMSRLSPVPSGLVQEQKGQEIDTASVKNAEKDSASNKHWDGVFQMMEEFEMTRKQPPLTNASLVSPSSGPYQSVILSTPTTSSTSPTTSLSSATITTTTTTTTTIFATSSTATTVTTPTTSAANSTLSRSRPETEKSNKTMKGTNHSKSVDQSVKHDPLFAPDIKPEAVAVKSDSKQQPLKEKSNDASDKNSVHSDSSNKDLETKEKKSSHAKTSSSNSHTERKVTKSSSKDEKKESERRQDYHSSQKALEKVRPESGSKNRSKEGETHTRGKESDSYNKTKDADNGSKNKETADTHSKIKDSDISVKNKDGDSHVKSKDKKDAHNKYKEKETDAHVKGESRDVDSVKLKDNEQSTKAKGKESHGKSSDLAESQAKNKEKDVADKGKDGECHRKGSELDGHKSKSKHREEGKKEVLKDLSGEVEGKNKLRELSVESEVKNKSKDRHDANKREKKEKDDSFVRKVSSEKKVLEKGEATKDEKKNLGKQDEKKAEEKDKKDKKISEIHEKEKERNKSRDKHDNKHEAKPKAENPEAKKEKLNTPKDQKVQADDQKQCSTSTKAASFKSNKEGKDSKSSKNKDEKTGLSKNTSKSKSKDKEKKEKEEEDKDKEKEKEKERDREKERQKKEKEKEKQRKDAKEKKKESELAKSKKKPPEEIDDFPYHMLEEPVYTSMYDTIKRRSCNKVQQVKEVSEDTRKKLTQLKSRRGSAKKSKSSRSILEDSSSEESDQENLSLDSDSHSSDSGSRIEIKPKQNQKQQPPLPSAAKKKRAFVLSSSSDDDDVEEDEEALLRISKAKPKSSQEKKFRQIFDSSSDSEEDNGKKSSPERPPSKPKVAAKPDKKVKPKKPPKKSKSIEESNDSDSPDLHILTKPTVTAFSITSDISMTEDTNDEVEKMDAEPSKKTKRKKKVDEKQIVKQKKTDEVPAKKQKLSQSKDNLTEKKEKLSDKKNKGSEKEKKEKAAVVKNENKNSIADEENSMLVSTSENSGHQSSNISVEEGIKDKLVEEEDKNKKKEGGAKLKSVDNDVPNQENMVMQTKSKSEKEKTVIKKKKPRVDSHKPGLDNTSLSRADSEKELPHAVSRQEVVEEPVIKEVVKAEKGTKSIKTEKEKKKPRQKDGKSSKTDMPENEGSKPPTQKMAAATSASEVKMSPQTAGKKPVTETAVPESKKDGTKLDKEKKEKKGKKKGQNKTDLHTGASSSLLAKEAQREPILQTLAEDMEREEQQNLKEIVEDKMSEASPENSSIDDTGKCKAKRKKKKKKEVTEKSHPIIGFEPCLLEAEQTKEPEPEVDSEPAAPEHMEPEDEFVSFWGHPAPVLPKKRDSVPKLEDSREKDDKEKDKKQSKDQSNDSVQTGPSVSDDGTLADGKDAADNNSVPIAEEDKPKPASWDAPVFPKDTESAPALTASDSSIDQKPKPLIDIPEYAFKAELDELGEKSDIDSLNTDKIQNAGEKGVKKKMKKKKEKSERKSSKEIDPLAAVESSLEATNALRDETVLLQDVIDKKAIFPDRRYSFEDEILKDSSPLFSEARTNRDTHSPHLTQDSKLPTVLKLEAKSAVVNKKEPTGPSVSKPQVPEPAVVDSSVDVVTKTENSETKVISEIDNAEKAASTITDTLQSAQKQIEDGEGTLVSPLERDELAMQAASDEAARAVECLLGFEEESQYTYGVGENIQMAGIPSEVSEVMNTGATLTSPAAATLLDPTSIQSKPETSESEIPEASEAPHNSSQPDAQEESLSVTEHQEVPQEAETHPEVTPETSKKGQRRAKRQNKPKAAKEPPHKEDLNIPSQYQQDMPINDSKAYTSGESAAVHVFGESAAVHVFGESNLPPEPDLPRIDGSETRKNPIDAYDFDAQMDEEETGLVVESAVSSFHCTAQEDQPQIMKSPRRRNNSSRGRGRRGRGGVIREVLEKMNKSNQPPPSPVADLQPQAPVPIAASGPVIPPWQQSIVKDDLASPESKTDLDSSYGEAELVINLEDQVTPTSMDDRSGKNQFQFGSDSEDKSPAQQNSASVTSPYKSQRSTRTRKPTDYIAMDRGLGMNIPSPRSSRSGSSPRGARGGQSPKNPPASRGRGSPKMTEFSSPVVKLEKLEMGRGKRREDALHKGRSGGRESEGIDIVHTSFEDWKASNMLSSTKPISKENIYEFEDSEQEQRPEPSPILRLVRGRNKRISESNEPLAARTQESFQGPPTHLHQRAQAPELGFKDLQEEQAQGSDDSSSSMSNVDKIIDAVSKGIFDCGDRKQETETPASIVSKPSTSVMGQNSSHGIKNMSGSKFPTMDLDMKAESYGIPPALTCKSGTDMSVGSVLLGEAVKLDMETCLHGKASKIKQEVHIGSASYGELSSNLPHNYSSCFPPGSIQSLESAATGGKSSSQIKQETTPVSTAAWQSVITTASVTHSKMSPQIVEVSQSGISSPGQVQGMAELNLRSKKPEGIRQPLEQMTTPSSQHHQPQAQPGLTFGRSGLGSAEASLAHMTLLTTMSQPVVSLAAVTEHGRRSGMFAFPVSREQMSSVAGSVFTQAASQEPRYTTSKVSGAPVNVITVGQHGSAVSSAGGIVTHKHGPHTGLPSPTTMPPVPALVQAPHAQSSPKQPPGMTKSWPGGMQPSASLLAGQQQPINTPPPPQMSPTSSMQPQRPQSVQLPVMPHMDPNPSPVSLRRPPSAHSSQTVLNAGRERPGCQPPHQGDMRPPSLPSELLTQGHDREHLLQGHIASLHQIPAVMRQGLAPHGFVVVHGDHGVQVIPHSLSPMPPPSPHAQHEASKLVSSAASIVNSSSQLNVTTSVTPPITSHLLGQRRGSLQDQSLSKMPPSSTAGTLYSGVVAGQPRSLSPKTASPVGQVIERLPNPIRPMDSLPGPGGPTQAHCLTSSPVHQDPTLVVRYHKDDGSLRPVQPPAAHSSHEVIMMHGSMVDQQRQILMSRNAAHEVARSMVARGSGSGREPQEHGRNVALVQELVRTSALQDGPNRTSAVGQEAARAKEAARKEMWVASGHEPGVGRPSQSMERSLQEAGLAARVVQDGSHKMSPLSSHRESQMLGLTSATSLIQQVPLNLADPDSRSSSSEIRGGGSSGSKPSPSPFNMTSGPNYVDRGGKVGERQSLESAFVSPAGGGPPNAHREIRPPHLYAADMQVFQPPPPFGMGVGRVQFDPRTIYGSQHPHQFISSKDAVLGSFQNFITASQIHQDAERLIKKGELPPSGPLPTGIALPMVRSPSPIPSPSRGLLTEMVGHHILRLPPILGRYPLVWSGMLALKNDQSHVQMHFVSGSRELPDQALPQPLISGASLPLRISQRMRLETPNLEGVTKRMINERDYTLLLAVPSGHDQLDVNEQTKSLTIGFIDYLRSKLAAGIVNVSQPGSQQAAFVVHVFPPCDFSMDVVARHSTGLVEQIHDLAHVIIIITTV
ncbi:protein split ends-like isoform X2 [Pomacea canaliculata]|nr:protein split ends-like isoform X2 [Pomacea canaliculata]XP_025083038.1 protein split ends-like isoform X2 [Pomacea canaliculata]